MLSFLRKNQYSYLINKNLQAICRKLKRRLKTLNDPEDIIVTAFCWTAFKKSRIYEICAQKKPKLLYKEPQNMPDLIESIIVDMWTVHYGYSNSFSPISENILIGWLKLCNETGIGLLGNAGWKMQDLVIIHDKINIRYNEYSTAFELTMKGDSKNSFKFGEKIVQNVFGENDSENISLLMSSNILLTSEILGIIDKFKDFDFKKRK